MKVIVWYADAMYKISGHQHPQRPSYGGLKRVTVSGFSPILSIHIQMTISQAWGGLFQKFQSLKSIVWSAPSLDKGPRSTASKGFKLRPLKVDIDRKIEVNFQMTISLAWNELFQKFQSLKLIVFLLYPSRNKDQTWVDKCQYHSFFKF